MSAAIAGFILGLVSGLVLGALYMLHVVRPIVSLLWAIARDQIDDPRKAAMDAAHKIDPNGMWISYPK